MYYKLIYECAECNSILLQIGAVNILVNVPLEILRKCVKFPIHGNGATRNNKLQSGISRKTEEGTTNGHREPLDVHQHNEGDIHSAALQRDNDIYSTIGCFEIHVIIANTARGLEGLDLLAEFYGLKNTHIVCTRPAYTIAKICQEFYGSLQQSGHFYRQSNGHIASGDSIESNDKASEKQTLLDKFRKGISFRGFSEETRDNGTGVVIRDPMETGHMHAVSYNEDVKLAIATDIASSILSSARSDIQEAYNRQHLEQKSPSGRVDPNCTRKFITRLIIHGVPSGFSLGSANWIITHGDSKIAIIGPSVVSFTAEHCKGIELDIFQAADHFIVLDGACSKGNIPDGYTTSTGKLSAHNEDIPHKLDVVMENMARKALSSQLPVIIPVDVYSEHIFNILTALSDGLRKTNTFIYCVGEGMTSLFDFVEKCTEWSNMQDFIRSYQTEDVEDIEILHPLYRIEDLIERRLLYIGNTLDDVKSEFKTPCVLILGIHRGSTLVDYIRACMNSGTHRLILVDEKLTSLLYGSTHTCKWESVDTFDLDYRADAKELIPTIPEGKMVITSKRLSPFHPGASFSPTQFIPLENKFTGFLKGKIGTDDVTRVLMPNVKQIKGTSTHVGVVRANVSKSIVTLQDTEAMMIDTPQDDVMEEPTEITRPIFFGAFSVYDLAKFLESKGYSDLQVLDSDYPKKVWNDDFVITLESPQKTIIETTDNIHRKNIMQSLQQVLSVV